MTPELKQQWLEALRGQKYKQGQGHLQNRYGRFCCLGVLCDVVNPEAWFRRPSGASSWITKEDGEEYESDGELLSHHLRQFGLTQRQMSTLIHMNDGDMASFDEIAHWVEDHL